MRRYRNWLRRRTSCLVAKSVPGESPAEGAAFQSRGVPGAADANLILLKVGVGCQVPQHTHVGSEYTQVLSGAFTDAAGRYAAGDCVEANEDIDHQPVVDGDVECICLAAVEGRLRLRSFVARLLQPMLGI